MSEEPELPVPATLPGGDPPGPLEAEARAWAPDVAERRLDRRVVTLWRVAIAGNVFFVALAAALLGRWLPWGVHGAAAAGGVAALGALLAVAWPPAAHRAWTYRMRERDLVVRRGVVWRTTSVIPFSRIQHVDTRHGPVDRWLGLASVVVFTAGVRGADATIPGLAAADAEALRERLASLGDAEDAV